MTRARIEALGDSALLVHFGDRIDRTANACALAAARALAAAHLPGLLDIAPAYASVCVRYDPLAWSDPADGVTPYARIAARVSTLVDNAPLSPAPGEPGAIDIPVCYGDEFGPDLGALAEHAALSQAAVIACHCAANYRVAMLGFAPGFPYLLGLDAALYMPRHASPRIRVPAGSVAIGGAQTGIYPRASPGGWQIIGRTPLTLFDARRDPPALLLPGQRVRFRSIDTAEFANWPS